MKATNSSGDLLVTTNAPPAVRAGSNGAAR